MNLQYQFPRNKLIFLLFAVCIASFLLVACSRAEPTLPPFPLYMVKSSQQYNTSREHQLSAQDVSFTNLTVENGLSQNSVMCIFQDSRGFIWLCTNEGINRYDGYEFVNFRPDPQNPDSLRDNVVNAIVEDQYGNLWFGTQTGLDVYYPEYDKVTHVNLGTGEVVLVTILIVDQTGDLWVGTHQGVFRLEIEGDQILETTHFDLLNIDGVTLDENPVGSLFQDSHGVVWVGTRYGLGRFDLITDSFSWALLEPFKSGYVATQAIISIEPDMLLLGGGYGLISFDTVTHTATPITSYDIFYPSRTPNFTIVWSIVQDDTGMIWLGTDTGLIRLNPDTYKGEFFSQIQENSDDQETVISLLQDQEGNLWVGTWKQGIFVHQTLRQKFALPDKYILDVLRRISVWSLYEDYQGFLWVGTDRELIKIDRGNRKIIRYPYQPDKPEKQIDSRVQAIIEDPSKNLWIGTASGHIYFYHRENNTFVRMFAESISSDTNISQFYSDKDGDIWIGTNQGLYCYQVNLDRFIYFRSDPQDPNTLSYPNISAIQEDEIGNLWVGTWHGLNLFNEETGQFSRVFFTEPNAVSIIDDAVLSILPTPSGGLWLGGKGGGLRHFDPSTGKIIRFQDTEGITAGMIFSILEDVEGNLWLSSNRGLSKFDPDLEVFTNFSLKDGLPNNEFNQGAYFQNEDGELFFGGIDGFVSFFPVEIPLNAYAPPIVLTEITQNGEKVNADVPADRLETLTLTWPNNYFEFKFAALSYTRPENNQYAYYLEGIDPDWVYDGKNRTGRYVNLPGGTYTLHLIGSNSDGVWNTQGKTIQITVIPPIWQQNWFQITIAFCFVAILFVGYRYRVRNILARSKELENLVSERTSDLLRINEQLVGEIADREKAEHRLSQRIAAEATLAERSRLARDLHDAVTQTIFSASILSEALPHTLEVNPQKGEHQIEELQQLTRGALAELRSLLFELRPEGLVRADLNELLSQLGKGITGRSGIHVEIICDTKVKIPSEVKITLYRIAQEALNNASRHADPTHIKILCNGNQEYISLLIQDDGKGFKYNEKIDSRMGLGIMQERAADIGANLEVKSQPGEGTTIMVEWLFPKNGASDE